jgi:hypothetical protein
VAHGRSALVAVASLACGGCYGYAISATERPVPATVVEVTLNDRGRIAMEPRVGPDVLSIEGTVVAAGDSSIVLEARRVVDLQRRPSTWAGESVTVRLEHVRLLRERRWSAGRTFLLAGGITAGAMAVFLGPLGGSLSGSPSDPGGGGNGGVVD